MSNHAARGVTPNSEHRIAGGRPAEPTEPTGRHTAGA